MSNQKKAIILAVALVVILVAAVFGYRTLSGRWNTSENNTGDVTLAENEAEPSATGESVLEPATDFTVQNGDGETVYLSDHFGKPIIVNFWASWCPPCQAEMPYFDAAYEVYGDQVEFLMVNLTDGSRETIDSAKEFITENGYSFPVYYDTQGSGVNAYGVMSIPTTVCITPEGDVYSLQSGSFSEESLQALLERLIENS